MRKVVIFCLILATISLVRITNLTAATLVWNSPTCTAAAGNCPTGYNVYWKDLAVPATEYHADYAAATTSANVNEFRLQPGKTYQFTVTAFNGAGESGRSNTVDYLAPIYVPPADFLPPVVIVIPGTAVTVTVSP